MNSREIVDSWDPQQYKKFEKERNQPFFDLLKLIVPKEKMEVVDLGCGTGQLTRILHDTVGAKHTVGIDSSLAMLKESAAFISPGLSFELQNIEDFTPQKKYDLIFSNAALQWVPHHEELFTRLARFLNNEGQIAIQMPANFDAPTHRLARETAAEKDFVTCMREGRDPAVLCVEEYAQLLFQLGFKVQQVRLQVYPHQLSSADDMVEWVKGSLLTYYRSRLPHHLYNQFVKRYKERIIQFYGAHKPVFYPFKRLLIWGRLDVS